MTPATYPVRVDAELQRDLSRWLWLVKWVLAIPHYVVLAFLWVAFLATSVAAFFAILLTGRYPRAIFEFNVGVLRWTWRVAYYTYGALATDRYPPFTLDEVPEYPTHLTIRYPERLSRGLVLVKWWLLAIPHYIVVGLFLGTGAWVAWQAGHWQWAWGGGLLGLMVLVAAVVLAVNGRYPSGVFDFVLGMNRWVLRVAAYAGLMTDDYPPFRLDLGGMEPDGTLSVSTVATEPRTASTTRSPGLVPAVPARPDRPSPSTRWSGGRVVAMVVGIFLLLGSLGLLGGGAVALWADRTQRDGAGFITSPTRTFSTGTYALTTEGVAIRVEGPAWIPGALGTIRLRVGPTDAGASVFAGIGPTAEVERYLRGVERGTVTDPARPTLRVVPGGPPTTTPGDQTFWFASSLGTDTRTLSWTPSEGSWTVVVMNPDAHPGIDVRANVGATVPALPWIATGLLIAGVLFLLAGTASIVLAARSGSSEGS